MRKITALLGVSVLSLTVLAPMSTSVADKPETVKSNTLPMERPISMQVSRSKPRASLAEKQILLTEIAKENAIRVQVEAKRVQLAIQAKALEAARVKEHMRVAANKVIAANRAAQATKVVVKPVKRRSSVSPVPVAEPRASYGSPQAYARGVLGATQFNCLDRLFNKESGWRWNASNPSGAYGIPQALPGNKMNSAGSDWRTNPITQVRWGIQYIESRYGSACNAWSHSVSNNWY